eukprot:TRINITY_DN5050_c0_g2_i1.p1 TRINITY_DN5050_c0_g2~~TRINITY_DN5050_c0_g2_i1.p1  ORF type:complete len:466 (+),score=142.45 TRINITY_DN5050_c0_g2_i1:345-1742(+)
MEKYRQCIADCDRTLQINPNFAKAYRRRGKSRLALGLIDEANSDYQRAKELEPNDEALQREAADCIRVKEWLAELEDDVDKKRYSQANFILSKIMEFAPEWKEQRYRQIELLARHGQVERALEISKNLFAEASSSPDFLYARGIALLYNGSAEQAKRMFQEALRVDPDHKKSMNAFKTMKKVEDLKEKGNNAFKNNEYDQAIEFYSQAIDLDKDNKNVVAILLANRAAAYVKKDQDNEAMKDLKQSIELNDNYAKAFIRKGEVHMRRNEPEDALRDFERARGIDPHAADFGRLIKEAKQAVKMAKRKDYYKILGVEKSASLDEVKRAYKKLALKHHPDKNPPEMREEAEKKFKEVAEAYAVLSDDQKRRRYDSGMDDLDGPDLFGGGGMGGGIDPSFIFSQFFGGASPFGGGFGHGGFGGGGDDEDLFGSMGGGRSGSNRGGGGFPFGGGFPGGMPFHVKFSHGK